MLGTEGCFGIEGVWDLESKLDALFLFVQKRSSRLCDLSVCDRR